MGGFLSTSAKHRTVLRLCQGRAGPLKSSRKYEPLTQGNGLNPNYDGSSTERDEPKQSSHVKHAFRSLSALDCKKAFFHCMFFDYSL